MTLDAQKSKATLLELLDDRPKSLSEYYRILVRRRLALVLPAALIAILTYLLAVSLPSIYRSEATLLIEDQEMPKDIVGATMNSYAIRQIEFISRRVLTAQSIQTIVDKLDVYGPIEDQSPQAMEFLASRFRADMNLALVSSEELEAQRGAGDPTIAFELSFESRDPEMAQTVVNELVSVFLSENRRASTSRSEDVSQILEASIRDANKSLLAREAELAAFKERYPNALPQFNELNLTLFDRTEQQLSDIDLRIQSLQQRQIQLSSDLAQLNPSAPVTLPTGETIMGDRERLRALLIDYKRKAAVYQPGHPDIVRLENEIATLQQSAGNTSAFDLLQDELRTQRDRLESLRERYSDDHPDVRSAAAAIVNLESAIRNSEPSSPSWEQTADNPAYVMVQTQLRTTNLELENQLQRRVELQEKLRKYDRLIQQAPQVEVEYEALSRSYEDARALYMDLQAKLRAADIASDVGVGITGQRFTILEPPMLPRYPSSPNRPVILVFGFVIALVVGGGFALTKEAFDDGIYGAQQLSEVVGSAPLAVIPYLNNSEDVSQRRRGTVLWLLAALTIFAALFFYTRHVVPLL